MTAQPTTLTEAGTQPTEYLHAGWWPTVDLADVWIATGAAVGILASLRSDRAEGDDPGSAP